MKKTSLCCLLTSFAWNGFTYKFTSEEEKEAQSQLALSVLDKEAMSRMFNLNNKIENIECRKDSTCKVNELMYIPIYEKDLLTVDNLSDSSTPEMIINNIDIPPVFKLKKYDPTKYIQVRVICDYADPKWLKKCKNEEEKLWEIENVFIDFHGGGFLIGNSNDHCKKSTSLFAKNYEGPIFSVDYRLAPKYQYPDPINDSWLVYLWVIKYAEKYLKIRFKKIFVLGVSAGANLGLGVTTLAIQKNVRIPDGVIVTYPAMDCNMNQFSPSLLMSLDDFFMSISFLMFALENFCADPLKVEFNPVMNPKYIPDEMLAKFPPCRFITAGLDPLRDESIRFIVRLLKQKINVKWIDFRFCLHGFVYHNEMPFYLKETIDYLPKLIEVTNEIIELANQ